MKRFWADATVAEVADEFAVLLDGKPLNLPSGATLRLANPHLAAAVAAEWGAAAATFGPDDLPLTRLATTARQRVPGRRPDLVAQLAAYGLNDLLCYRAADNDQLAAEEATAWDPWLAWSVRQHGVALCTGIGLAHVPQPPEALAAFTATLTALTDGDLAGLGVIVPTLGSLILGLGVAAGALGAAAACDLAELDALWQESRWGADQEAIDRRAAIAKDVAISVQFMILCRQ